MSVLDLEITLNRFGFRRIGSNKLQIGFLRVAWWKLPKYALSVEVNWLK